MGLYTGAVLFAGTTERVQAAAAAPVK